ncbi:MAG: anti-sigma factor [Synechococcaceae cyanobacterium RM1_1_27]|nr:anti-sigma factor [Synechococcaceae cyanobacterium SM2_3_2]NJO85954.1 anti-sigma factor [Synechococcaceae cyanobacterium RM1_1_27]
MNNLSNEQNELLAGFVTGDLDPTELEQCRHLLANHPELAAEIGALEESLGLVINSFVSTDPPIALRQKLITAVELADSAGIPIGQPDAEGSSSVVSIAQWKQRSRWDWRLLANGVAAALVVGMGFQTFQLQHQLSQTEVMLTAFQSPSARLFPLETPDGSRRGVMMFDPVLQQASFVAHNMPMPETSSTSVYQLWVVAGSRLIPCGDPKPVQPSLVIDFSITPGQYSELYEPNLEGFILTLEESPTITQPTGPVILQSV